MRRPIRLILRSAWRAARLPRRRQPARRREPVQSSASQAVRATAPSAALARRRSEHESDTASIGQIGAARSRPPRGARPTSTFGRRHPLARGEPLTPTPARAGSARAATRTSGHAERWNLRRSSRLSLTSTGRRRLASVVVSKGAVAVMSLTRLTNRPAIPCRRANPLETSPAGCASSGSGSARSGRRAPPDWIADRLDSLRPEPSRREPGGLQARARCARRLEMGQGAGARARRLSSRSSKRLEHGLRSRDVAASGLPGEPGTGKTTVARLLRRCTARWPAAAAGICRRRSIARARRPV